MDAFATVGDLETRLGRTFTADQTAQIEALLADASTYLRDIIGQQVYPQQSATFKAWPEQGRVYLPQQPVVEVTLVTRNNMPIEWDEFPDYIAVRGDQPVQVSFTYGYAAAPEGLMRWCCVLVSQTLTTLELNLGLSVGGLSSVGIDDFRAAFSDGGGSTGMSLTPDNIDLLRSQYASTVTVGSMG